MTLFNFSPSLFPATTVALIDLVAPENETDK
jgi:hypothetical protein